jgi:succinate dehydrogenase/fumarate reductase flavoprotein subunit
MIQSLESLGEVIDSDILILGSGAAGCGAALAARERGIKALLVDKGKLESSGCVGGGNDHFMAVLNTDAVTDSTEAAIKVYYTPTSGVTPRMVEQWIETMPHLIGFLEEIGIDFARNPDGTYLRSVGFGQPGAWYMNINNGQVVKRRIAGKVRSAGVDVLDHVMITRILVANGRAVGALGYNILDGSFLIIRAKAVIMALGNSALRATANSTGNPFNTWHNPFNTGSQYVLAYDAGARIINLDIQQQATLLPKSFGCAGMNGINGAGAHELNALGERFMGKYHPMKENGPRRFQIMGTHQQIVEGKGPPFHVDMRHCDPEEVRHLQNVLMPGDKATFLDYAEQKGIDFSKYPMEVELSEIEFCGMIQTDENFESSLPGLYNGCVFYSFSGSMGSGYLAGKSAAAACLEVPGPRAIDVEEVAREKDRILRPLDVEEGIPCRQVETAIRQVMSYYMGYVRNQQGMEIALDRLKLIESYTDRMMAGNFHELLRAHESVHLLKTCRLSTLATIERKETGRSIYRRSDYPDLNDAYKKSLAVWRENGKPKLSWL